MNPVLSKLILSREKSVKALKLDIDKMDELAGSSRSPAVQAGLLEVIAVKRQRLVKLEGELAAFREEAQRQVGLPAVDPTIRKKS